MDYFKTEPVTDSVIRIIGIAGEQMYLIKGKHHAVLVDTGCGVEDLRSLVETMTSLPLTVILTHGHMDHALGAALFDKALMHPADFPVLESHSRMDFRLEYLSALPENDFRRIKEHLVPPPDISQFKPVREGDIFDLGGLHLRIYECAGHTPGSICILIEEERLLITGDAANLLTFMFLEFCTSIHDYRENLIALKEKTEGKYDIALVSHGEASGDAYMVSDVIDACNHILAGEGTDVSMEFMGEIGYLAMDVNEQFFRRDGRQGNIVFSKTNI